MGKWVMVMQCVNKSVRLLPLCPPYRLPLSHQSVTRSSSEIMVLIPWLTGKSANKIQGQSLQHALVDLASAKGIQALYVMISQAVSLNNLAVMHWFPPRNINWRLSEEYRDEFARLEKLDLITKDEFHKRKWRPVALRTQELSQ